MDINVIKRLEKEFGHHASFAYWDEEDFGKVPNFYDKKIRKQLNNNFMFVALHPAANHGDNSSLPFKNFHSSNKQMAKDYKLHYSIKNYRNIYGSYITDFYKGHFSRGSNSLKLSNEMFNKTAIANLNSEIKILGSKITIFALGRKTEQVLKKHKNELKGVVKIIYITHYSYHFNGCANVKVYCNKVKQQLAKNHII